jgi:hypothetical protein
MAGPGATERSKTLYRWTRDVHLYAGLFAGPFVLIFALSALSLNHTWRPWGGRDAALPRKGVVQIAVQDSPNSLDVAKQVRAQVGIVGEIGFVGRRPGTARLSFPIETPGRTTNVRVDLEARTATFETRDTGVWEALNYLHTMPGPHNMNLRGNWWGTRLWGWLADASVCLILFLTVSGIYLWSVLRADRRAGILFLGAGIVSFIVLVMAVVA